MVRVTAKRAEPLPDWIERTIRLPAGAAGADQALSVPEGHCGGDRRPGARAGVGAQERADRLHRVADGVDRAFRGARSQRSWS
jgi:hypothetical protein